jgi:hypothetical protein
VKIASVLKLTSNNPPALFVLSVSENIHRKPDFREDPF